MKKGMGMIEVVISLIFLGMISEIVMGIGQQEKFNTDSIISMNTHILLDSEVSQNKARCRMLNSATCTSMGGNFTGNNNLTIGDTCSWSYQEQGANNQNFDITNLCTKTGEFLFDINTNVQGFSMDISGEGFISVQ